jgi:hypothetical protein
LGTAVTALRDDLPLAGEILWRQNHTTVRARAGLLFAVVLFGTSTCGPTRTVIRAIDSAFDCHGICKRYQSCFDSDYDVSACADRCRDAAAKDSDYRRKAEKCAECIGDKACTKATFSCGFQCAAVVP